MGGFQFAVPLGQDAEDNRTKGPMQLLVSKITPVGMLFFLYGGWEVPCLTKRDIEDKSKADAVTKILSCLQAAWLMLQIIGRVKQALPVTELETNTLAHVICAFLIYVLWFRKPYRIGHPQTIDLDSPIGGAIAYYHLFRGTANGPVLLDEQITVRRTNHSTNPRRRTRLIKRRTDDYETVGGSQTAFLPQNLWADMNVYEKLCEESVLFEGIPTPVEILSRKGQWSILRNCIFVIALRTVDTQDANAIIVANFKEVFFQELPRIVVLTRAKVSRAARIAQWSDDIIRKPGARTPVHWRVVEREVDPWLFEFYVRFWKDPERDKIAKQVDEKYRAFCNNFPEYAKVDACPPLLSQRKNMLHQNLPSSLKKKALPVTGVLILSTIYGGLHLAMWNSHFPTIIEMWLWRGSSVLVCVNIFSVFFFVASIEGWDEPRLGHARLEVLWLGLLTFLSTLVEIVFVFGRTFLVLEAFISLRSQPPSAYQQPAWTQYIPHI